MTKIFDVEAFVDGGCVPNPGNMGIGIILMCDKRAKLISMPLGQGTNNIAEIRSVIEMSKLVFHPERTNLKVYSDSNLIVNFINGGYKPKRNVELVKEMIAITKRFKSFQISHVKAHADNQWNNECDKLASTAIQSNKLKISDHQMM